MDQPKTQLSDLTAAEAREVLGRNPVILLPLGSLEDQGPHVPMGDYRLCERISALMAERAFNDGVETLVAPVLPFGGADHFGSVPGGIALSQATLRAVLGDMLDGLARHGLTRVVIVNGHSGNAQAIHDVTQARVRRDGVLVPCFHVWRTAFRLFAELVGPEAATARAGHGADPLGSIAMALFPDLVRPDLAIARARRPDPEALGLPVTGFGLLRFGSAEITVPLEMDVLAPDGIVSGDPCLANAEDGAALVKALVASGAAFIAHCASHLP